MGLRSARASPPMVRAPNMRMSKLSQEPHKVSALPVLQARLSCGCVTWTAIRWQAEQSRFIRPCMHGLRPVHRMDVAALPSFLQPRYPQLLRLLTVQSSSRRLHCPASPPISSGSQPPGIRARWQSSSKSILKFWRLPTRQHSWVPAVAWKDFHLQQFYLDPDHFCRRENTLESIHVRER